MRYVVILFGVVSSSLISLPACTPQAGQQAEPAAQEAPSIEADVQALEDLLEKEIALINDGDMEGLLTIVTEDTVWMPPNHPAVFGKEALLTWSQGLTSQFKIDLVGAAEEIKVCGDWAIQRYSMTMTMTPTAGGEAIREDGKGIHIYQRQSDGSWKLARDIWNSDSPVPEESST